MTRTSRITVQDDGFRLWPGRYAIVAQDWNGTVADPRTDAGEYSELVLPVSDGPALVDYEGMDVLVLPVGRDAAGCPGRSIAVEMDTLAVFERLAIVAVDDDTSPRHSRYASHLNEVSILTVQDGLLVSGQAEGGYDFDGNDGSDLHQGIDAETPGAFTIDGIMFDMADEHVAKAFGYGSEAFNAKLDEHGFPCDLAAVRRRIQEEMDGPHSVIVLNQLRGMGDFAIAYYAPVQP